jgi:hypothetical protein
MTNSAAKKTGQQQRVKPNKIKLRKLSAEQILINDEKKQLKLNLI